MARKGSAMMRKEKSYHSPKAVTSAIQALWPYTVSQEMVANFQLSFSKAAMRLFAKPRPIPWCTLD
jgi:hypothetical protein